MSSDNVKTIALPSRFSQVQLSGLKEVVEHHYANGHQVQFDASEVDKIDGAAVQFLMAVSKTQSTSEQPVSTLKNVNEIVVIALSDMGIEIPIQLENQENVTTTARA